MSTVPFPTKEEIEKINLFFIIGRPRSGTTLLRTLLDAHPNVIIPMETPFSLLLARKYNKLKYWTKEDIKQFVKDIQVIWLFRTLKIDINILQTNLMTLKGETDYITLCKAVMLNVNSIFPKKNILIVGDKNPPYSVMFHELFKIFGTKCKYIHLIRDYRDVHLSLMTKKFDFPYPAVTVIRWKRSFKQINRIKTKNKELFHTLHYEELVTSPETELKKICDFLSISYDSKIINFHEKKNEIEQAFPSLTFRDIHKNLLSPIRPDKVGSYEKGLTQRQIKICDLVAGKTAIAAGYKKKFNSYNVINYINSVPGIILFQFLTLSVWVTKRLWFNLYIRIMCKSISSIIWNKYILRRKF